MRLGAVVAFTLVLFAAAGAFGRHVAAQDAGSIRIVHAVSDAGPIDVAIDGRLAVIGAAFPSVTDPLTLAAGEHRLTVTPSGAGPESAVVDVSVAVEAGATAEIAIVGAAGAIEALPTAVDVSQLDPDRARLRVVHVSPDAGPLDVAVSGGDAVFPTVEYRDASEYADVPAGAFGLDWLAPDGTLVASLPDLALDAGEVADVFLVGLVADGSVQPFVVRGEAAVVPRSGHPAEVRSGSCDALGASVGAVGVVAPPRGANVGAATAAPVENGFGTVAVSFDALVSSPHVVVVADSDAAGSPVLACGAVAGALTDDGSLAAPLVGLDGAPRGLAVLAPGVLDPQTIDVSVFLLPDSPAPNGNPPGASSQAATSDAFVAPTQADGIRVDEGGTPVVGE